MNICSVFKAVSVAKDYIGRICNEEVIKSKVNQDGDVYFIWLEMDSGICHGVKIDAYSGAVLDDVWF